MYTQEQKHLNSGKSREESKINWNPELQFHFEFSETNYRLCFLNIAYMPYNATSVLQNSFYELLKIVFLIGVGSSLEGSHSSSGKMTIPRDGCVYPIISCKFYF